MPPKRKVICDTFLTVRCHGFFTTLSACTSLPLQVICIGNQVPGGQFFGRDCLQQLRVKILEQVNLTALAVETEVRIFLWAT